VPEYRPQVFDGRAEPVVTLWDEHVLPRLTYRLLSSRDVTRRRRQAVVGLRGHVVEIGFGAGPNVPHYPAAVTAVSAVEPSVVARRLAAGRIAASSVAISLVGLDGQDLPLADASCDSALSTFTLCTVPDPDRAMRELRRVLRPGGVLHVLEHGLSPDPRTARWQHRLDPLEQALVGGCHLVRPVEDMLTRAGFTLDRVSTHELRGPRVSRPWGHLTVAHARSPAAPVDPEESP
jgi:SAM-dependent methyltransferase